MRQPRGQSQGSGCGPVPRRQKVPGTFDDPETRAVAYKEKVPQSFLRPNPGSNLRIRPDAEALTATGAVRNATVHVDGRAIHTKCEILSWKSPRLFVYKSPQWVGMRRSRVYHLTGSSQVSSGRFTSRQIRPAIDLSASGVAKIPAHFGPFWPLVRPYAVR